MDGQDDDDDEDESEEIAEIEKWSEYVEKYCSTSEINEEMKEALLKRTVFLTRNAHHWKQRHEASTKSTTEETRKVGEVGGLTPIKEENETEKKSDLISHDDTVYQWMLDSFKPKVGLSSYSMMYRRNALRNAKKVN